LVQRLTAVPNRRFTPLRLQKRYLFVPSLLVFLSIKTPVLEEEEKLNEITFKHSI
jgi:hypothetical protein